MKRLGGIVVLAAACAALLGGATARAVELPYSGSDLRLWLRADGSLNLDPGPANADRVLDWYDYTGVGGNTVADDGVGPSGNRPLWVAGVVNGLPIVRFDASQRRINGPGALLTSGTSGKTVFVVAELGTGSASDGALIDLTGDAATVATGAEYAVTKEVALRVNGGYRVFDSALPSANFGIVMVQTPASGNTNNTVAALDGTALAPSSTQALAINTAAAPWRVGGTRRVGGTMREFRGDIAEILVFESELSAAEQLAVGSYLQQKYGLSGAYNPAPTQVFFDGLGLTDNTNWLRDGNWNTALRPTASQDPYIGNGLTAAIAQAGAVANDVYVGHNQPTLAGAGTLTIDGAAASLTATRLRIGTGGQDGTVNFVRGTMTLTGTSSDQSLYVGHDAGSTGTFTMGTLGGNDADTALVYSGGRFEVSRVGGATGTFTLNSGTVTGTQNFIVGQGGGTANVYIRGGSLTTTTDMNFNNGAGLLEQTGGAVSVNNLNLSNQAAGSSVVTVNGGTFSVQGNVDDRNGPSTINLGGSGRLNLYGNAATREVDNFNHTGAAVLQLGLYNNTTGVSAPLNVKTLGTFAGTPTIEIENRIAANAATVVAWVDGSNTWDDDPVGKWAGDVLPANGASAIPTGSEFNVITSPNNMTNPGLLSSGTAGWSIVVPDLKTVRIRRTGGPIGGAATAQIDGAASVVARNADLRIAPESGADAAQLELANDASLTLSGTSNLVIGGGQLGTVNHNGGTLTIGGNLRFGPNPGDEGGTYNLNGGMLHVMGHIIETDAAVNNAQLMINGGTLVVDGNITVQRFSVGEAASSNGASYTIPAGQTVHSTGSTVVGSNGTNASLVVNGSLTADGTSWVGQLANSSGTLTVNPGASVTINNTWEIADAAGTAGAVVLNGGTFTANQGFVQATNATAQASLTVEDGAVLNVSGANFETSSNGTGAVLWRGGTLNQINNNVIVGQNAGSDATFEMRGGTLNIAGSGQIRVANKADVTGKFLLYGGTVNMGGQMDTFTNAAGTNTTGSGLIVVDDTQPGSSAPAVLNVGTHLVLGGANVAGGATQMDLRSGTVTVGGNLRLASGGSGQSATFNLSGGTLDMTGGDVTFGPGTAAFHFTGGRLQDVANFGSSLTQQGGTLAPGASPGTTSIAGDYDLLGGSIEIEIEGTGVPGADYDLVDVTGNAKLDGLVDAVALAPLSLGDTFDVLVADEITLGPDFRVSQNFSYRLLADYARGGMADVLQLNYVPEPASAVSCLVAAMLAIGALAVRRRNRRRSELRIDR